MQAGSAVNLHHRGAGLAATAPPTARTAPGIYRRVHLTAAKPRRNIALSSRSFERAARSHPFGRDRPPERGTMKTVTLKRTMVLTAAALLALSASGFAQNKPQMPKEKTLYARIGGYDVLAGITDDFLDQFKADEAFKRFGTGRSIGSLVRARQLIVDQLCSLTGGPCIYFGREMKPAHEGLAITKAEWDSSIVKLTNSMVKFKLGAAEQKELLAIFDKVQKDIVEAPK